MDSNLPILKLTARTEKLPVGQPTAYSNGPFSLVPRLASPLRSRLRPCFLDREVSSNLVHQVKSVKFWLDCAVALFKLVALFVFPSPYYTTHLNSDARHLYFVNIMKLGYLYFLLDFLWFTLLTTLFNQNWNRKWTEKNFLLYAIFAKTMTNQLLLL